MSEKSNWAEMDKRIRNRRVSWSVEEKAALDSDLAALPDNAENVVAVDVPQPAFVQPEVEEEDAAAAAPVAEEPAPAPVAVS